MAIDSNGEGIGDAVGKSFDRVRSAPDGVGKPYGIRECTVAERSIAAAKGEVIGRK